MTEETLAPDISKCDWRKDPNSNDTPRRVAKAYVNDLWKGRYDQAPDITAFPSDGYDGTIYTLDFSTVVTDVENPLVSSTPNVFELHQNYPNPFNPSTIISFSLPKSGITTLKIYDVLGREITTLIDEMKNAGVYTYEFDAGNLSSGIYIYSLQSSDILMTKKMLLVK